MTHPRQAIRDEFVSIVTGLATTGARVWASRVYPYDPVKEGGPGLFVYTVAETSARDSMGPPYSTTRRLSVVVEAQASVNETLDDTLDSISEEIEEAYLAATPTLNGLVKESWLESTTIALRDQGELQTGCLILTFNVIYRVVPVDGDLLAEDEEAPIVRNTGLQFNFEGNGSALPLTKYQDMPITFDCVITGWVTVTQQTGDIEFKVWSDDYAAFPPTVADSIVGSNPPKIVADDQGEGDVTGWSEVALSAGSVLRVGIASNNGIEDAVLTLKVRRTS